MKNSCCVLTHTIFSQKLLNAPLGEVANSSKFVDLLKNHCLAKQFDIYELCGENLEWFYSLAHLNMIMHEEESEPLIAMDQTPFKKMRKDFKEAVHSFSHVLLLTWAQSIAALLGLDFLAGKNTIAKFYLFHFEEKIPLSLYQPFNLLVTESPLALIKAKSLGIAPHKLLYLPHQFPLVVEKISSNRDFYKKKLLKKWNRETSLLLVGMFCRFQYRKNVEYALKALKRLYLEGYEFIFYLKGDFDGSLEGELKPYTNWLKQTLLGYEDSSWLIWDSKSSAFPDILEEYAAVDFSLQISGAESASNTIVEQMALGVPVIVLNSSTNPSLFSEGVEYVKADKLAPGALPFYVPDEEDLYDKIKRMIEEKDRREHFSNNAKKIAYQRFHPERCHQKIPLMMDLTSLNSIKKREETFIEDLNAYGIHI